MLPQPLGANTQEVTVLPTCFSSHQNYHELRELTIYICVASAPHLRQVRYLHTPAQEGRTTFTHESTQGPTFGWSEMAAFNETTDPQPSQESPSFSLLTTLRYDPLLASAPSALASGIISPLATPWNATPQPGERPELYMLPLHRDRMLRAARHFGWERAVRLLEDGEGGGGSGLTMLGSCIGQEVDAHLAGLGDLEEDRQRPLGVRVLVARDGALSVVIRGPPAPTVQPVASLATLFPGRLPPPPGEVGTEGQAAVLNGDPPRSVAYDVILPLSGMGRAAPDTESGDASSHGAPAHVVRRSEFTHFKTTSRGMYDAARLAAGIGAPHPAITGGPSAISEPPRSAGPAEVLIVDGASTAGPVVMECSASTPYFWRAGRWVTPPVARRYDPGRGSGGQDGTTRRWALER